LAAPLKDLKSTQTALSRVLQFQPNDPVLQNESAYLSLLLDTRDPNARRIAEKLVLDHPGSPLFVYTLALARIRDGNPAAAVELMEKLKPSADRPPVRRQYLYAAALGLAGQRERARQMARQIDPHHLRDQERALIVDWLPE
jgi:predicted Zn-dependent protease